MIIDSNFIFKFSFSVTNCWYLVDQHPICQKSQLYLCCRKMSVKNVKSGEVVCSSFTPLTLFSV